jgi:hypothetical protein
MPAEEPMPRFSGMKHVSILVVVAILVAACEGSVSSRPPDQSQAPGQSEAQDPSQAPSSGTGGAGGGGASLVEAANAVTDWCTVMPADLAAELVPGASEPQSQLFIPLKCTVSNGVSVLEITYQSFVVAEMGPDAESISGIAENAWLEPGYPVDDAYLTVIFGSDPAGTFYVEVAGHDGVDHRDDAIAVAQAVIAELS